MKKVILIILFFGCYSLFSQIAGKAKDYQKGDTINESIKVYDTLGSASELKIPIKGYYTLVYRYRWKSIGKGFDNADSIRLLEEKIASVLLGGMVGNLKVICLSYDKAPDYPTWQQNLKAMKPFKSTDKYSLEYYNLNGNKDSETRCQVLFTKLSLLGPDGRILGYYSSIAKFRYHLKDEKINLKGKVVTDDNGTKEPLKNVLVHIEAGNKRDTLGKATTDNYGDFEVKIPNNDTSYTIKADPKNDKVKNVLLLTQEGKEISYLRKTFKMFEYKLLKADILELTEMKLDDDITLTFKKFEGSKESELMVIEDITYDLNSFKLDPSSEQILNKVVSILEKNNKIKLQIISHTDAQGDDASNMTLSQKRASSVADYLISKGISEKRISALGKGETQIRNRCFNKVDCTDKEHRYNRRTEFKFSK